MPQPGWVGPGQPHHLLPGTRGLLPSMGMISSRSELAHKKNYYLKIEEEEVMNM